jgi:hypothetical protein
MPVIGIHSREPSGCVLGLLFCGSELNVDNTRHATLSANFDMVSQERVLHGCKKFQDRVKEEDGELEVAGHLPFLGAFCVVGQAVSAASEQGKLVTTPTTLGSPAVT